MAQFYRYLGFAHGNLLDVNRDDLFKRYPDCKEYKIRIDSAEWNELERMIDEFNFWTEENFKVNKDVLDGSAYILEGNRPQAKKCGKKTYKLVARGSPRFDKIGALCGYILDYEEQLKFKYAQSNRIK